MAPRLADVEVGAELPSQSFTITRADLVRYAGASGDFNVIHWNERVDTAVGLEEEFPPRMKTNAKPRRRQTKAKVVR